MTSAYGRENYDYNIDNRGNYYDGWIEDNLKNGRIVYDIDEGIIKKRINGQWLELPNDTDSSNTSVKRLQLPSDTGISDVSSTTNTLINNIIRPGQNYVNNSQENFAFPTNEQLQAMDNKKISESADALNLKEKKIKSLEDIANMTENDARMENGVNYKHKKDKNTPYQRKFFENVETSKIINQEVKDTIEMTTYERQSNEETLEKAKNKLDEQGEKLIKQWEMKNKNFTSEDVAIGAILIERYQQRGLYHIRMQ